MFTTAPACTSAAALWQEGQSTISLYHGDGVWFEGGLPISSSLRPGRAHAKVGKLTKPNCNERPLLQVLSRAAGHGDWRAANPCCSATLPQLELMLCLPSPLFILVR